jgi:L-asparaginase / beta-aspartyl-peptidase
MSLIILVMQIHPRRIALVVHGGAGNSKQNEDGCVAAASAGFRLLTDGSDALTCAVHAVVALEDDERFNAGAGSIRRTDNCTIEADAAVMDTRGHLGAVACLRHIKNPVLVARRVAESDHWLLAGEGALQFARSYGAGEADLFASSPEPEAAAVACDTVGAVALDSEGHFAVACSTGGSAPALPGRVGDTPIVGSGFYAGPAGAVAATGVGEHIVARMLARAVYESLRNGVPVQEALDWGVAQIPGSLEVGLIAVTHSGAAIASNRPMPAHVMQHAG